MRKLAIAMALASTALAGPALARDNVWYVGIEGGVSIVEDVDFDSTFVINGIRTDSNNTASLDAKRGIDLDVIAGYDFGMFRAEAEAGYKRASLDEITFGPEGGSPVTTDVDGSVRVYSAMINLLLDFGDDDGWNGYVGAGAGLANVRYKLNYATPGFTGSGTDSDRSVAFQGIAGVRKAVSDNVDLGLKYRYFVAPKLDYNLDFNGELSGKYKSHSLLASLIFNFAPPPPPPVVVVETPPPPPPPPATQTCYDGSVILATDVCPEQPAPPPPPPPEPAPERG